MQEGAWARRSENTVLTALVRLAALHEPLRTALSSQVPRQLLPTLFGPSQAACHLYETRARRAQLHSCCTPAPNRREPT